jgi:flagellar biosynthesis chaperone FliJ
MLAMCRKDPEILPDVLGHFVAIASETIDHERVLAQKSDAGGDLDSVNSEEEEILDDIRETLALARSQRVLPPVRIARILAGEGIGQFSTSSTVGSTRETTEEKGEDKNTVPLSVALDYVGEMLDESRRDISRLKAEVEEYNELCNNMEAEVDALLSGNMVDRSAVQEQPQPINIEEMYSRLRLAMEDQGYGAKQENRTVQAREAFWREMNQSDDRFETICRFFSKGIIQ